MENSGDFPGGPVVKHPPSNAGDAGSIPGQGTKIPRAVGHLSPHLTATELPLLNERARMPQQRSRVLQPDAAKKKSGKFFVYL